MASFNTVALAAQPLLGPVVALNLWTFVMEGWMYATRLPAFERYKVKVSPNLLMSDLDKQLPPHIQWKAHNYNHLMEQPTQYYGICLTLALLGVKDNVTTRLAWTYVGLRIIHSIIQATVNKIPLRFGVFAASSLTLAGMTAKAAIELFRA